METNRDWRVVRLEIAEHLADAATSFLADEGVTTLVTGVRETAVEPDANEASILEAHVPAAGASALAGGLARWLRSLAAIDAAAARARVTTTSLPALDWDAVFRAHHRPLAVGDRLLVAPPWDVPDAPGREVLVIEPGMAFGTGQHETTRTCLEEIEAAVAERTVRSALDVGTGTGVLATALVRLGVPHVTALDTDRAVLPLARANLDRNGAAAVHLIAGGAAAVGARFDLVVANLLADILITDAAALASVVAPAGRLVVSGLLDSQADVVVAAFPAFRVTAVRAADPWRTLRLER